MPKSILFSLLSIIALSFTAFQTPDFRARTTKWVVSENSSLTVNGRTNVNKFSCAIIDYPRTDTIMVNRDQTNKRVVLSGRLNLHVGSFDCKNLMMTRQLRKTLKQDDFPLMHISFLSLKEFPSAGQSTIRGLVEIEMAGVKKRFDISYRFSMNGNSIILLGSQALNFSDFKLEPPKKMGKLIQAQDELNVEFYLKMQLAA